MVKVFNHVYLVLSDYLQNIECPVSRRTLLKCDFLTGYDKIRMNLFWTGQKDLKPNTIQGQTPRLAMLLAIHPFPARGVHQSSETSSNELQRLFARSHIYLSGGYTSQDFVTACRRCAITTALQPSTYIYIYKGFLTVPKVESTLPLNHHFLISTDLSVGAPAGTHTPHPPTVPISTLEASYHQSNHRI